MEKQSNFSSSSPSWVRSSCIGQGCFGTVSKAVSKIDGGVFAVKSVDLATCLPAQSESLENEITILRSLKSHPHIVTFLGDDVTNEGTTSFRNLHLEYLQKGDVAKIVDDETLLRRYVWCLVSALRHVHANGIVHCDVKAKNVLVADGGSSVKLADFGSAMELEKPTVEIAPRGSPLWMAPEVVRREYQGPESDVWSLGCTVIEMLTGKPAWEDHGFDSLSRIGFSNELPFIPAGSSELCRDFLDKCLRRERSKRWSCDRLLEHPFLCQDHHSLLATESSPRCVLDWVDSEFEEERDESSVESMVSAVTRISKLATTGGVIWESNGWTEVRGNGFEEPGAEWELNSSDSTGDSGTRTVDEDSELTSVITCEILVLLPTSEFFSADPLLSLDRQCVQGEKTCRSKNRNRSRGHHPRCPNGLLRKTNSNRLIRLYNKNNRRQQQQRRIAARSYTNRPPRSRLGGRMGPPKIRINASLMLLRWPSHTLERRHPKPMDTSSCLHGPQNFSLKP
ncbi:unnamed protein product [Eruca vesicaria subsp. sativa]|uniref:Protein kinase domain-containing protein n=1 Tax=Eruca vesicaria subsp. sativa TaxID=29727 RepID=A0ABC8JDC7_ERUVS|nr:unnamed protein product [Eruca vesicaria subsp. sativa]